MPRISNRSPRWRPITARSFQVFGTRAALAFPRRPVHRCLVSLAFETAVCYMSEFKNPGHDMPRAIIVSGLICIVAYVTVPVVFQGVLGTQKMLDPGIADGSGMGLALAEHAARWSASHQDLSNPAVLQSNHGNYHGDGRIIPNPQPGRKGRLAAEIPKLR